MICRNYACHWLDWLPLPFVQMQSTKREWASTSWGGAVSKWDRELESKRRPVTEVLRRYSPLGIKTPLVCKVVETRRRGRDLRVETSSVAERSRFFPKAWQLDYLAKKHAKCRTFFVSRTAFSRPSSTTSFRRRHYFKSLVRPDAGGAGALNPAVLDGESASFAISRTATTWG